MVPIQCVWLLCFVAQVDVKALKHGLWDQLHDTTVTPQVQGRVDSAVCCVCVCVCVCVLHFFPFVHTPVVQHRSSE